MFALCCREDVEAIIHGHLREFEQPAFRTTWTFPCSSSLPILSLARKELNTED